MSLLALLACLLAQHAFPVKGRQLLMAFYGRMCLSAAKRLNAGDRNSGILAWFVLMGAVIVPVALAAGLAAAVHTALLWVVNVLFLYATLRFLATIRALAAIEKTLIEHHPGAGANLLAEWLAEPVATEVVVIGAAHLLLIARILVARHAAGRQRAADLERFEKLKSGV